jgi:hypothetical protein
MQSAIAQQAEAERHRRAKVINSEGEYQAAAKLAEAAEVIEPNPVTLQLRYLQALTEISSNQGSTIVFPLPIDMLRPLLDSGARSKDADERQAGPAALPEGGDGSQEHLSQRT